MHFEWSSIGDNLAKATINFKALLLQIFILRWLRVCLEFKYSKATLEKKAYI